MFFVGDGHAQLAADAEAAGSEELAAVALGHRPDRRLL